MSTHDSQGSDKARDPYAFYASSVGPRILENANKIFEEFPVSKYILYFCVFMVEVAAVFYISIKFMQ